MQVERNLLVGGDPSRGPMDQPPRKGSKGTGYPTDCPCPSGKNTAPSVSQRGERGLREPLRVLIVQAGDPGRRPWWEPSRAAGEQGEGVLRSRSAAPESQIWDWGRTLSRDGVLTLPDTPEPEPQVTEITEWNQNPRSEHAELSATEGSRRKPTASWRTQQGCAAPFCASVRLIPACHL